MKNLHKKNININSIDNYPVSKMCKIANVSKSGYCK